MQLKPDLEDNGVISKAFLKKICKTTSGKVEFRPT